MWEGKVEIQYSTSRNFRSSKATVVFHRDTANAYIWLYRQRKLRHEKFHGCTKLSHDKIGHLDAINFDWVGGVYQWSVGGGGGENRFAVDSCICPGLA